MYLVQLVSVCGKVLHSISLSVRLPSATTLLAGFTLKGWPNKTATPLLSGLLAPHQQCQARPPKHTVQCVTARVSLGARARARARIRPTRHCPQVLVVRRNQGLGLFWPGSGPVLVSG